MLFWQITISTLIGPILIPNLKSNPEEIASSVIMPAKYLTPVLKNLCCSENSSINPQSLLCFSISNVT